MELEEVVEALDAAIEYKNELIANKQLELRQNVQRSQNGLGVLSRLKSMSADESRSLLTRYFQKVVDLRDEQRKMHQHCSQLEVRIVFPTVNISPMHSLFLSSISCRESQNPHQVCTVIFWKHLACRNVIFVSNISPVEMLCIFVWNIVPAEMLSLFQTSCLHECYLCFKHLACRNVIYLCFKYLAYRNVMYLCSKYLAWMNVV